MQHPPGSAECEWALDPQLGTREDSPGPREFLLWERRTQVSGWLHIPFPVVFHPHVTGVTGVIPHCPGTSPPRSPFFSLPHSFTLHVSLGLKTGRGRCSPCLLGNHGVEIATVNRYELICQAPRKKLHLGDRDTEASGRGNLHISTCQETAGSQSSGTCDQQGPDSKGLEYTSLSVSESQFPYGWGRVFS